MKKKYSFIIFLFSFLCSFSSAYSQTEFIYIKASKAYITIGNDKKLKGPINCSDIVTINETHKEIAILSEFAKAYKINKKEYKGYFEDGPNSYLLTVYYISDKDGYEVKFNYFLYTEKEYNTNVRIMFSDKNGTTVLEGKLNGVM